MLAAAREIFARLGAKPALAETDEMMQKVASVWLRRLGPRSRQDRPGGWRYRNSGGCVRIVFFVFAPVSSLPVLP